jgi:hypothetical protein
MCGCVERGRTEEMLIMKYDNNDIMTSKERKMGKTNQRILSTEEEEAKNARNQKKLTRKKETRKARRKSKLKLNMRVRMG